MMCPLWWLCSGHIHYNSAVGEDVPAIQRVQSEFPDRSAHHGLMSGLIVLAIAFAIGAVFFVVRRMSPPK
jgi:hypothetical protein